MTDDATPSKHARRAAHRKRIEDRKAAEISKKALRRFDHQTDNMAARLHNEGRTDEQS